MKQRYNTVAAQNDEWVRGPFYNAAIQIVFQSTGKLHQSDRVARATKSQRLACEPKAPSVFSTVEHAIVHTYNTRRNVLAVVEIAHWLCSTTVQN